MEPFIEADKVRRNIHNQEMWIQGLYIKAALDCTVGNMFKKTSAKPIEYPKEPYPFFADKKVVDEDRELTEEEKTELQKKFLMQLQIMESNFKTCKK